MTSPVIPQLAIAASHREIVSMAPKLLDFSNLSVNERLQLVEELWDSIDDEQIPMPDWHREELDRRLAAYDADPSAGMPLGGGPGAPVQAGPVVLPLVVQPFAEADFARRGTSFSSAASGNATDNPLRSASLASTRVELHSRCMTATTSPALLDCGALAIPRLPGVVLAWLQSVSPCRAFVQAKEYLQGHQRECM
jgi:putative addiction module component (TIGR02574 family)